MGAIQERLAGARAAREKIEAERRAEAQRADLEREQKEREATLERERIKRELAAMSEEQRCRDAFCQKLAGHTTLKPTDAGAAILGECIAFLANAAAWPERERKQCAEQLTPLLKAKNMYIGKKEKQIKEALKNLHG